MTKWYWLGGGFIILVIVAVLWPGRPSADIVISVEPDSSQDGTQFRRSNFGTGTANLIFVGDMMLTRSVGIKTNTVGGGDHTFPFQLVAPQLQPYDLVFGNLETTISNRGTKVGSIYSFRSDPGVVEGLKLASFDVVSIANNHIWDYSKQAFLDTLDHLTAASISYVGGGRKFADAHAGVIKEVKGTKVAFLAYTDLLTKQLSVSDTQPGITWLDPEQMKKDIAAAKTRADLVVVSFHFGDEYKTIHNAHQAEIAHAAIDAGADLIIGHHPHVVQDMKQYKGKWIAYSLGNFIFDQYFSEETMRGGALQVKLEDRQISEVKLLPVTINKDYQPMIEVETEGSR